MANWYVYQHDGPPLGPWSTETVARAIVAGTLKPDICVAAPGGPRWLRALEVPVIARLAAGAPLPPARRGSGLIPKVFSADRGKPMFEATMMSVEDDEVSTFPSTRRGLSPLGDDGSGKPAREADTAAISARAARPIVDDAPTLVALDDEVPSTDPRLLTRKTA